MSDYVKGLLGQNYRLAAFPKDEKARSLNIATGGL
jgi:hypothetical protein